MGKSLIDKKSFIGLEQCAWFYCGAESPPHRGTLDAVTEYFINRSLGPEGRLRNADIEQSCKRNISKLLKGKAEQIAFLSNVSEIISLIALSLELQPGDNVVINELEFPSGVLPWILLKSQGIEVRVVPHTNWQVSVEDILARVDHRTKLVVASHVSYISGARLNYKELYRQLKETSTYFLLDATQSLGVVPVDMNDADFVVCSSYKWLLSTHGAGILAVNPARTANFNPKMVGWRGVTDMFSSHRFDSFQFFSDARRFDLGYPSYPTLYSMNYTTAILLEIGIENIEKYILSLGDHLIKELQRKGYQLMTPIESGDRAGNVSFIYPEGEKAAEYLSQKQIYVWGGDGRIRVSIHLYNDSEDIEKLVDSLPNHSV